MDRTFIILLLFFISAFGKTASEDDLPTLYQYYTEGGIRKGLEATSQGFELNGKDLVIQSGAIHYFRVHPDYWRDRLRKLRATGLVAVETYVPWNLHEPEKDVFDFGDGGREMSPFLDVVTFLKTAREEDLLVLLRPGPYICAEWDLGGLPSWLLRIDGIKLRSSEEKYMERVGIFFDEFLSRVKNYQFTNNGSIIAVQLENEYSSVGYPEGPQQEYLRQLKNVMDRNGITQLLYTSDNYLDPNGGIPEALRTVNFARDVTANLNNLVSIQPDKPPMVMEFWTGWYDQWMNPVARLGFPPSEFGKNLEDIITFPASFNLYMFHGGTNWGFLNGANAGNSRYDKRFDTTSYDYDAPLSESGDYTEKYQILKNLVKKYSKIDLKIPDEPAETIKKAYPSSSIKEYLDLNSIYEISTSLESPIESENLVNMENLPVNNENGQSFGFVWYRKKDLEIKKKSTLKIIGNVHDVAQVFVDGKLQTKVLENADDVDGFGYWKATNASITLSDDGSVLDILVENLGRVNYGIYTYEQKKGLYEGPVTIDDRQITGWQIIPIELKESWIQRLRNATWKSFEANGEGNFGVYRTFLNIEEEPQDTFVDMENWVKGNVVVNQFHLGRYNFLGPQQTLFLPAPLLKKGQNEIIVLEQFKANKEITFLDKAKLGGES